MKKWQTAAKIAVRLHSLALFRQVLEDEVVNAFLQMLETEAGTVQSIDAYCEFVSRLFKHKSNLGNWLLKLVLESENPAVKEIAAGGQLQLSVGACLEEELETFSMISSLNPEELRMKMQSTAPLPLFENTQHNFSKVYNERMKEIFTKGYGMFMHNHMFTLGEGGKLLPVRNPDPQRICELTGYEREREKIIVNTRALLAGLPANNVLLYGDAGTGKSSTVKALANEYKNKGLRLIEVRKNQMFAIPILMDNLAKNPLKFVLFIDDLSFPADDADFTNLKAILEGNINARPQNMVVYATTNRRHMVQQRHSDRTGDEISLNDTLEEQASLSARFGLNVTFSKPEKKLYLQIVHALAQEAGLKMAGENLEKKAEAHAIRHGGRSPRTARQFVEFCKAVQEEGAF